MTAASVWERLRTAELVEGERPPPDLAASPWFVRIMLGIAGWIGAGFLMGFVGAAFAFILQDAAYAFILGAACCAAAFFLLRSFDGNDFAEQFGLAVSLAGQGMIAIGLSQYMEADQAPFYFTLAAVEALLAWAMPNFLHRVLATSGAAIAFALGINQASLHGLTAPILCLGLALVWMEPRYWAAAGRIWRPVGYGLVLALLLVETFRLFGVQTWFGASNMDPGWMELHGPLIGRVLTAGVLVWVAAALTLREEPPPDGRVTLIAAAAASAFGLISLQAPGLGSAVLILLLGFAAANRILMALGILALLGFVSHYYYSLHATLLEKSGLLALTGLCLLAAWFALGRFYPASAAAEADHA